MAGGWWGAVVLGRGSGRRSRDVGGEGSADDSSRDPGAGPAIENPNVDLGHTGATMRELMGRLGQLRKLR